MSIGVLHGQNGGPGLAVKVVGGTVKPENPKEGTIWVNTDQNISAWSMRSTEPGSPVEGMVWLTINAEPAINTVKKNEIRVKPIRAKQYTGGVWVVKEAKYYDAGQWRELKVTPDFSYTGEYELVNDADEKITDTQDGNWKIRFLTSGTLTFQALNGAENGIDVFLVGGGAGGSQSAGQYSGGQGGGGGYTKTEIVYDLQVGTEYEIIIGAGGAAGKSNTLDPGGTSSAFGLSANGASGVDGGSGGGGSGYGAYGNGGNGGSDGSDGTNDNGGTGQGSTTREFGEADATLYSGGGGGERGHTSSANGTNGTGGEGGGGDCYCAGAANTGGGGGAEAAGGSGIVIIRNARRAV